MLGKFGVLNPFHDWKKEDFPCDPTVSIMLDQYGKNDRIIEISASLASDSEIDFAIDQLKNDLESTRRKAKQVLKAQRSKIKSAVGK
jgi:hypothetical protein